MALDGLWVDGVQQKFRPEDILDGDISAYTEPLVDAVETWMGENIEPGAAAVIDKTLTIDGAAADAKVVGDELADVKRDLNIVYDDAIIQIEISTLETIVPFFVHSGDKVTIQSKDGTAITAIQVRFIRANNTNDYWSINGYTSRTITMTEDFVSVYIKGGTAQSIIIKKTPKFLVSQDQLNTVIGTINLVSNHVDQVEITTKDIEKVIDYSKERGEGTVANGYATLKEPINLKKDTEYKAIWKFAQASTDSVYCYIVDSNSQNIFPGTTTMDSGESEFEVIFTPTSNLFNLTAKVYAGNGSGLVGSTCYFEIETTNSRFSEIERKTDRLLPSAFDNFKLIMPFAVGGLNGGDLDSNQKRISSAEPLTYSEPLKIHMDSEYRVGYVEFINDTTVWHGWYNDVTIPKAIVFKLQCARSTDGTGDNITDPYDNDIMGKMSITGVGNTVVDLEEEVKVLSKNDFGRNGLKSETFMYYALWSQGVAHVDDWLVGFTASNDDHTNVVNYTAMNFKNGYSYHSRGNHNLGHCASADYNSESDTLIVANGTYASGVIPTIYLVSNAKQTIDNGDDIFVTSSNVLPIVFDGIDGTGCLACFGETSDIIYVITAEDASDYSAYPERYLYKLVLGKGSVDMTSLYPTASFGSYISGKGSDEYNGTAYILKKYTGSYAIELQGMKYVNGRICLSCDLYVNNILTAYIMFLRTYEPDSSLVVDNIYWIPSLASDGSYPATESEDVAFADGNGYVTYVRSGLNDSKTIKFSLLQ